MYGPRAAQGGGGDNRGVVRCEFGVSSFGGAGSGGRRRGRNDRKSIDIGNLIAQTFESVVLVNLYEGSQIDVYIQVIQADGGVLAAAINATTLALVDAGVAMRDMVVSVSCGLLDSTVVCDMNYTEEQDGAAVTVAVTPSTGDVVLAQMEATRLPADQYPEVMEKAQRAVKVVRDFMAQIILANAVEMVESRGARGNA